ncbi:MAG: hypothetical protein KF901_03265 [Myxococcales bacterium]|nr:hypothetical protein [Myxococcales bacterium]
MSLPPNGLYRTTIPHPLAPEDFPAGRLVYVGRKGEEPFVVVPHFNENNRWFWREPVTPLTDERWASSLFPLPVEGFYTLPRVLELGGGGRWLENAIVQLGYDRSGQGILFVAEKREMMEENALYFSDRGHRIDDVLLSQLRWAPILPVSEAPDALRH